MCKLSGNKKGAAMTPRLSIFHSLRIQNHSAKDKAVQESGH